MRHSFLYTAILATTLSFAPISFSEEYQHSNNTEYVQQLAGLQVEQPWSRALPPTAHTGATFVNIHNSSTKADRLISAYSPMAEKTELHNHIHQDGLMKMVEVEAIEVPANGTLELKPGSYHVMLIGLKQPLKEGEHFPIRLDFEQAGSIDLEVVVKDMNAGTAAEHMER